jgi:hypothetical protein
MASRMIAACSTRPPIAFCWTVSAGLNGDAQTVAAAVWRMVAALAALEEVKALADARRPSRFCPRRRP